MRDVRRLARLANIRFVLQIILIWSFLSKWRLIMARRREGRRTDYSWQGAVGAVAMASNGSGFGQLVLVN